MCSQTFADIKEIILSLKSVKGVRLEVSAALWGADFAETADQDEYTGLVDRWMDPKEKTTLMVRWEGYNRCEQAPLDKLDTDADGTSLGLKLLPYENGHAAPTLQETPPPPPPPPPAAAREEQPRARAPAGEAAPAPTVTVNETAWTKELPEGINLDARTQDRYKPKLLRNQLSGLVTIDSLFDFFLPHQWIADILKYTNAKLQGHDSLNAKLTSGELKRFFGYMISLSVHNGLALDKMWSREAMVDSSLPPPAMGRWGIPLKRFQKIRQVLSFGPEDDESFDADEWCFVRPILDAFNARMKEAIEPGWLLGVDETMCAWRGAVGKRNRAKCPHRVFIKRKPEPCGVEFKNIGDALSGIILFVEMHEGKAEDLKWKWWREYGATTACTMRLSEHWHGTGRVVAGDSWFASVKTAEALGTKGLYFIGDVKSATKRYPVDAITDATSAESGAWATFSSTLQLGGDKTMPIYSVSHRRGEAVHKFVATCGTTLGGGSHWAYFEDEEDRYNAECKDFELTRKCPRVLNDFTLAQPTIDRHNRYRQHLLAMEKRFHTNNFSFRFFTTLLGTVAVNAFFAHRYFNSSVADFTAEMDKLGVRLMKNAEATAEQPSSPAAGVASPPLPDFEAVCHDAVSLKSVPGYKEATQGQKQGGKQQRCVWCNAPTSWCCKGCSTGPSHLVPICPPTTVGRKGEKKGVTVEHACLAHHRLQPTFFPKGKQQAQPGCGCKRARAVGGSPASPASPSDAESDAM